MWTIIKTNPRLLLNTTACSKEWLGATVCTISGRSRGLKTLSKRGHLTHGRRESLPFIGWRCPSEPRVSYKLLHTHTHTPKPHTWVWGFLTPGGIPASHDCSSYRDSSPVCIFQVAEFPVQSHPSKERRKTPAKIFKNCNWIWTLMGL